MKSILRLDKVVFDKIEFNRLGFKNDTELKLEIQTNIGERKDKAAYKVSVIAIGEKPDEYTFHISITGYFTFRTEDVETDLKNELISKNSVAILMQHKKSLFHIYQYLNYFLYKNILHLLMKKQNHLYSNMEIFALVL